MKAQVIAEFGVFLALGFFLLLLFASIIGSEIVHVSNRREFAAIDDLGLAAKSEVDLAAQALPGYERSFDLPQDIDGIPYNITIIQNSLIVSTGHTEVEYRIPGVDGAIGKGTNRIRNENGKIKLN